jgi:CBS domain-containing protein
MVARDLMTTQVVTLGPEATVREAADRLAAVRHNALPVVDDAGRVVGVVSYHELLRLVLPEYLDEMDLSFLPPSAAFFPAGEAATRLGDVRAREIMRREPLAEVPPDEPIAEVARLLLAEQAPQVLVVQEGALLGVITLGDLVRAMVHPRLDAEVGAAP